MIIYMYQIIYLLERHTICAWSDRLSTASRTCTCTSEPEEGGVTPSSQPMSLQCEYYIGSYYADTWNFRWLL